MSCTKFRNGRFRLMVAGEFPVTRAPDRRGRSVTGKADMTFAGIIDAMPLWAMALSVMLLLWLALCFRGLVAIVVTILCFIGLKSAGDPHLWIAIPVGLLVYGVLGAIRSEEHTSELQSLMRSSYAVFCLNKKHTN